MERIEELIRKYQEGRATPEERALVERHFLQTMQRQPISENETYKQEVFDNLDKQYGLRERRSVIGHLSRTRYAAAAAILLIALLGTWIFFGDALFNDQPQIINVQDIQPGGNRATLTLADGRTIDLSETQMGIVVRDGITYLDGSDIPYDGTLADASRPMSLTTPKGGTYQITLPDGSRVWLNAGSTLKYPARFDGAERVVELEGEAFFEVARMHAEPSASSMPFLVRTSSQTVEVLGTQFNVSAYADEPETRTTLVEGSVKVWDPSIQHAQVLAPGQQAILHGKQGHIAIQTVDTEQYTSWKDGLFALQGTISELLKAVSRWYDIEIVYEGNPTDTIALYTRLQRDMPLAGILESLAYYDPTLKFRLEEMKTNDKTSAERRLTVYR